VAEGVEDAPARVGAGHRVVLALVEEQARLLPAPQVGLEADVPLLHLHPLRHLPVEQADALVEALQRPHARVVALEDSRRPQQLDEDPDQLVLARLGALRQCLDDEMISVAVDDQRGEAVAFAVDQPARGGSLRHRLPPAHGGLDPVAQERLGERVAAIDHAEADLRPRRVEREAERAPPGALHLHDRAGGDPRGAHDVGPEDPGVAAQDAHLTLAADDDRPFDQSPPRGGGFYTAAEAVSVSSTSGVEGAPGVVGPPAEGCSRFTAPWNTAPSSITRRFAMKVPRARAVGARRRDSARTSPSNSPSI